MEVQRAGFERLIVIVYRYQWHCSYCTIWTHNVKLFVIAKRPPWPIHYGDRLHCYQLLQRLARRHEVLLVAQKPSEVSDWAFDFECRVARDGRLFEDQPDLAAEGYVADRIDRYFGIDMGFARDVVKLASEWQPDVVLGMNYHSLPVLARIKGVPTICDLLDDETLHALLELLHSRSTGKLDGLKCVLATALFQRRYIRQVDAVTVLSETDRRFCRLHTGHRLIRCIPHGVDCDHYAPQEDPEDENRLIFWGSLSFGPNIGAIRFFAEKVWPILRRQRPDLRWTVAGRGESPQLERYRSLPGVDWVGYVEDLRPLIAQSAVVVVPMLSGAGIKNKIMEAWAMGKAVVCTSRALGSLPGRHAENVWIANTAKKTARAVLTLANDRRLRARIGESARRTAVKHCSWDRAAADLEQLCLDLTLKLPLRYDVELASAAVPATARRQAEGKKGVPSKHGA